MSNRMIGVNSNCYHGFSIEQALEGIAKAGFHYVELTATKGWTEHVFPSQSFEYLCSIKQKMQRLGLQAFSMSGHCNLMDSQRLPDFEMNMQLAQFFGCSYIVSSVGEAHLKDNAVASNQKLAENIRSLLPALQRCGLQLVLELHGQHSTGSIMREIVELVNSPLVKINYDTANCLFYGNVHAAQDIDTCMQHVAYLHLKDKAGAAQDWDFPALGEGTVDFATIFEKLQAQGNNAPFSVEIEFTAAGPESLEQVNAAIQTSADYLKQRGFTL